MEEKQIKTINDLNKQDCVRSLENLSCPILNPPNDPDVFNILLLINAYYDLKDKLYQLNDLMNKEIDSEYSVLPKSSEDLIRKNAYCYAFQKAIWAIEDILHGD